MVGPGQPLLKVQPPRGRFILFQIVRKPLQPRRRQSLAVVLAAVLLPPAAAQGQLPAEEARPAFLAAEAALARGDGDAFVPLAARLRDYPLYPYLRFKALMANLDAASPATVEAFLTDHADTPLAERLRRAWLLRLAAQEDWDAYERLYRPTASTELRCHHLRALSTLGRTEEALAGVEPLWLTGASQPEACDAVFEAWRAAGRLTPALAWARIDLAMSAGETGLARYLGRFLPESERPWLERWLALRKDPTRVLNADHLQGEHPIRTRILSDAIIALAREAPEEAAAAWTAISGSVALEPDLAEQADAAVGLALSEAGDAKGLVFLDRIAARADNQTLQERRLRSALTLGDWARVAAWIAAMPEGEHKSEHWLYWQARAAEMLARADEAERLYREAAGERSLWGFLAAERAGLPYRLDSRPAPVEAERVARLVEGPGGRRIEELRALGRDLDVRREWLHLTRDLESEDLIAAAVLAERWGWPDQAIFTLARSGWWDDLALRFPLHHREVVSAQARETGLPESWIYAILRQESAFNPAAVSPAGARGLMQLMPATARSLAGGLKPAFRTADLDIPALNIALGSSYLARMRERFGGHPVLAAAAYNAGPGNVGRWLPARPLEADVWIATIPFRETRGYVRRVLAYRLIYDARLGRPPVPLGEELRPIDRASLSRANAGG